MKRTPIRRGAGRGLLMFDLDGTLFDTRRDLAAAVNRMRAEYGLPPLDTETVAGFVGDGIRVLVRRALRGHGADPDEAVARCARHYRRRLVDATRPYPGVAAGLRRLHRAGWRLALVSNKPTAACRRIARHFALDGLFDRIAGGDAAARLKPHPEPLRRVMAALDAGAESSWMIGDHKTDLEAARRAGVRCAFAGWGFGRRGRFRPRVVFESFPELAAFFLRPERKRFTTDRRGGQSAGAASPGGEYRRRSSSALRLFQSSWRV